MSRRTGRGVSALIRDAIDRLLKEGNTAAPLHQLADMRGLGRDPGGPAASEHDRTLYGGPK